MQDTVCRGILNGTMQGIYSIKDSTMQGFWPICKRYYYETVLCKEILCKDPLCYRWNIFLLILVLWNYGNQDSDNWGPSV